MSRTARIERVTSESSVVVELDLDGTGATDVDTTVPFYDHMLTALGRHSLIDLRVRASGDTHIDVHHTVEDTAICIGEALRVALGDKRGIRRFGQACVPLDEALAEAVVDISGRPYLVHTGESEAFVHHLIGGHFTGSRPWPAPCGPPWRTTPAWTPSPQPREPCHEPAHQPLRRGT